MDIDQDSIHPQANVTKKTHSQMSTNGDVDESAAKKRKQASGAGVPSDDITINGSVRPHDWPLSTGTIDLDVHDLPHDTSDTEWWYVNGHVRATNGQEFSFYASFFRIVKDWDATNQCYRHVHALTWALIDPQGRKYYCDPVLDVDTPDVVKKQLLEGVYKADPRQRDALLEVVGRGEAPLPDRVFSRPCTADKHQLKLQYDTNTFVKQPNGDYLCHCEHPTSGVALTLRLAPQKSVIRHGHGGVVKIGRKGDDMFYYFIPRCDVSGTVRLRGQEYEVTGRGWYDHEFGGLIRAKKGSEAAGEQKKDEGQGITHYGWNWLSCQLDDGTDISATSVVDASDRKRLKILDNFAIVIDKDSTRHEYNDDGVVFQGSRPWTSVRTTSQYPLEWALDIPEAGIHLQVVAAFPEQEIITLIARPAFWEGRVHVSGTVQGKNVSGVGFIERHGFTDTSSMDHFFGEVNAIVRQEIAELLPYQPTRDQVVELMADPQNTHYLNGLDIDVFTKTIIKPIREMVDRGGKSWRSYALLLCIDCVGGDSQRFKRWLSVPEIMHVGSLIVDDIQDKSELRRGGPTCHMMYGEALAINCGTAAYFIGLRILSNTPGLSDQQKLDIYESYFLTLRAGHAGQALDIYGLDYLMDEAVATGDNERLVGAIICTHRLKSAVPAGNLARMGAILGGGTKQQVDTLGTYFESIGIAFQVVDDVLNLRGMKTKDKGEDIKAGKVTHPVCLAMSGQRLNAAERKWLWDTIKSKPQDQKVVDAVIDKIEQCGALAASDKAANDMVEQAWAVLDPHLPSSFYKINLRSFGWYVLQRHY